MVCGAGAMGCDPVFVAKLQRCVEKTSSSQLRLSMLVLDLLTTLLPVELMTPTKSIKMEEEFRIAGCSSLLAGLGKSSS